MAYRESSRELELPPDFGAYLCCKVSQLHEPLATHLLSSEEVFAQTTVRYKRYGTPTRVNYLARGLISHLQRRQRPWYVMFLPCALLQTTQNRSSSHERYWEGFL